MAKPVSDAQGEHFARRLNAEDAERVLQSPDEKGKKEKLQRYLLRMAVKRAIVRLKEQGHVFKSGITTDTDKAKGNLKNFA